MSEKTRKIWNGVTTGFVVLVLLLTAMVAGPQLLGLQVYTVRSGSMEPAYKTGSLIYVKPVDDREIEAGQVITFRLNDRTVVTHRVIQVVDDGGIGYQTKGDANNIADGKLVRPEDVLGTPVCTIPGLGYVASFIKSPAGACISAAVACVLVAAVLLPDLLRDFKRK